MSNTPEPPLVTSHERDSGFRFFRRWRMDFSRPAGLLILALLRLHLRLGLDSARRLTVTHDEYWHLPAGVLAWQFGRFDFDNLNPPLTRQWASLPVVVKFAAVEDSRTFGPAVSSSYPGFGSVAYVPLFPVDF